MNSIHRIGAMMLRYVYLLKRSWPRILELFYWPAVQLILWGFITKFFLTNSTWLMQASGVLLAAVMLWDVMFRGHLGVSLAFFEEMYSRNLGYLFASPLRAVELTGALLLISLIRTLIGVGGAALLAIPRRELEKSIAHGVEPRASHPRQAGEPPALHPSPGRSGAAGRPRN